jgi:hypothetical protein
MTRGEIMADVYNGAPDERQATEAIKPSLFRPRYRQLTADELALHDAIKRDAETLAVTIARLNPEVAGRLGVVDVANSPMRADPASVTLALRHLDDAVYRAVKALTA